MPDQPDDFGLEDLDVFSGDREAAIPPAVEARAEDLDVFASGGEVALPDLPPQPGRTVSPPVGSVPTLPLDIGTGFSAPTIGVGAPEGEELDGLPAELQEHPRYEVVRRLGVGGMGSVYLAEHRVMGRRVALKVIRPDLMASENAAQRFEREVRTAASLHHPNVVAAYDAEREGDLHFLAMEYVEGTSLGELVGRSGPLPVAEACDYARQAALGLQYAHEQGMVHRDIKPDNLMLTPDGRVKILDFGIARFAHRQAEEAASQSSESDGGSGAITLAGSIMGTPDYMAPEQGTDSASVDIRADVYSLGCSLYFLLTGQVPFPGGTILQKVQAHLRDTPKPVRELRADVPPEVAAVLEKMMARTPADRFQSPGEAALALAAVEALPPTPVDPAPVGRNTPWAALALLGAGGFMLLFFVFVFWESMPFNPSGDAVASGHPSPAAYVMALLGLIGVGVGTFLLLKRRA